MIKVFLTLLAVLSIHFTLHGQQIKVVNQNYKQSRATWSPVEDLILFESNIEGKRSIYVMDSKGNNLKRITSRDYDDSFGSWSPDGQKILYQSVRDNQYHLFIHDLTNQTEIKLASSDYVTIAGHWSNNGEKIAYSARIKGGNNREIFIIDADCKNEKRLTHNSRIDIIPVFSKDDGRLFYQSNKNSKDQTYDIYSVDLQTFKIEQITSHPGNDTDPFIYPLNNKLGFFSGRTRSDGVKGGMFYMDLKTKEVEEIPLETWGHGYPSWSHDGKYIAIATPALARLKGKIYIYDIENEKRIELPQPSAFR